MPDELKVEAPPAPKNTGLNLGREIREQSDQDRVFGALSPSSLVSIPEAERDEYLPIGEVQFSTREDFQDCATRSPVNHLEALFTYHYRHKMKPENKAWLDARGYVKDGRVTFSDRFVAINSGTTKQGNSLKAPIHAIHKEGLIPKSMLPKGEHMTFEEYHDKSKITLSMKTLGLAFLRRFAINYEQVQPRHFEDVLKDDMIGVAGHAWPLPIEGIYPKSDDEFNHAFIIYKNPKYQAYDNYYDYTDQGHQIPGDFTKNLAPDYNFFKYGYRMIVTAETTDEELTIQEQVRQALKKYNLLNFFSRWWSLFTTQPYVMVPPPAAIPSNNLLNAFCLAIQKHEDWVIPGGRYRNGAIAPLGSVSFRCMNPGNARFYTGGYLPIYGTVTESNLGKNVQTGARGFAIFRDYETGFLYLKNMVRNKIQKNPRWTFYDFFQVYAPSIENDSELYAEQVAKACGRSPSSLVSSIL